MPRESRVTGDIDVHDMAVDSDDDAETRCGLLIVDTTTGHATDWVRFEGVVRELYDVAALPGIRQPMAIGFKSDEIRRFVSFPEE